jgi:hypothetical protein
LIDVSSRSDGFTVSLMKNGCFLYIGRFEVNGTICLLSDFTNDKNSGISIPPLSTSISNVATYLSIKDINITAEADNNNNTDATILLQKVNVVDSNNKAK